MFCTKCGFEIKDGYKFCPKCGTPAYVEKEEPKSEVKNEEIDEVAKEAKVSLDNDSGIKSSEKVKNTKKTEKASKPKEKRSNSTPYDVPNSMVALELDIDGVKQKAEQGNKVAMLRQAFRYEVGIGTERDIDKAEYLYGKVGGKNILLLLEDGHINCILPSVYDAANPPTYNSMGDLNSNLKVIPFVKDILLDYSHKIEQAKNQKSLSIEKSEKYREEFIQRLRVVRDLYPELLFINLGGVVTEDDYIKFFDVIKQNSENRFRLKWIPSLFNYIDLIDNNRIIIPSIYDIKSNGLFTIRYNDKKDRLHILNQFIMLLLIQLPIKKILLNFVDLEGKFEYDYLLKQLPPVIYGETPIVSEEQMVVLLKRLEERRLEMIKNYGNYSEYCEQKRAIPIPYEIVIIFDDVVVPQYEKSIYNLIRDSYRIGVFFIIFDNRGIPKLTIEGENRIGNGKTNNLYSYMRPSFSQIWDSGVVIQKKQNEIYYDFSQKEQNHYYNNLDFNINGDTWEGNVNTKMSLDEVAKHSDKKIYRHVCNNDDDVLKYFIFEDESNIKDGKGSYNVFLRITRFPDVMKYDIKPNNFLIFKKGLKNQNISTKQDLLTKLLSSDDFLLNSFETEKDAQKYMNNLTLPHISYRENNRIRFVPYFIEGKSVDQIGIALYIPKESYSHINFKDDMITYLTSVGFPIDRIQLFLDEILGNIFVSYLPFKYFPNSYTNNKCLCLHDELRCRINFSCYNGYFIPDFFVSKYKMDFGFWGFNARNTQDVEIATQAIAKCQSDIVGIEKNIDKFATDKWGEKYEKDHLAFKDVYNNVEYLEMKKVYRIPFMKYTSISDNSIITPIQLVNNTLFSKVYFSYIKREAEAKEEMKVQNFEFGSAAESKYETDLSTMIIPVGKAEYKDADFRLDLVSHVHSFIIGQSGSGKSVFLHNIIGGAMLKYAPEDLQLYLLDFKLGGVEFNRYQGAKHVKALLVDNSDPQVTLEILRELRGSMTERGKLLRSAGVNNIGEYNKLHQQDRMPHVLVVADECHEMFKADDSIPRQVRNEISDIVIKIAKEGRSQGVHLVFATQTLSGTEISSEIINNVSDFYLLKCAQTDSERLVPNSSAITSELSTGQIYYHHVDEQVKFQAYYTDKEAAEKLMDAIVEKAKDHKSNGEFYFNGAQMFYLDESVKEQMQAVKGKSPVAFMGKAIDISQKDLYIKLNEDFSENVLLLGLNDQEQVTRTTMNLFVSLMMSAKLKHRDIAFKVIDCLNNEEGEVHELIFDLENEGYCDIIERRQRSKFFKELAQGIQKGTAEETILLILGQDRFRELKNDLPLEDGDTDSTSSSGDPMMTINAFLDDDGSSSNDYKAESNIKTYREALNIILDKGPDYGVHTLLQLEKVTNFLFDDYISAKVVFQKFKHLVMLRSDEMTGSRIGLSDDIRLEKLCSDWERLRAYYYAEESDSYMLFTPYMPSKSKNNINLLKTI